MTEYPDNGCAASPHCLDCVLPKCIEEVRGEAREIKVRDLHMLDALRRGVDIDRIAKFYDVAGERQPDKRRTVHRALARARLYERAVGIPPRPLERVVAERVVDVRVRLHLRPPPKTFRKPVRHTRDWHDRLLILRAWGFPLSMMRIAAGRLDHSTLYHHFREECRCGLPDRSGRKVDVGAAEAA